MSVDKKVQFLIFNDPNYVSGIAYCYSAFKKWIRPQEISPDAFGLSLTGFAILNEDLKTYQSWLEKDKDGKACKRRVEQESEVQVANLENSLRGFAALIAINPLAIIRQKGADYRVVNQEMVATLNHERIHAYQVLCPSFEKWSLQQWEQLPQNKKNEVIQKHPEYNWTDQKTAGREYAAFLLEAKVETIPNLIGQCQL